MRYHHLASGHIAFDFPAVFVIEVPIKRTKRFQMLPNLRAQNSLRIIRRLDFHRHSEGKFLFQKLSALNQHTHFPVRKNIRDAGDTEMEIKEIKDYWMKRKRLVT
jgi:hypothetical protein